MQMKRYDSAVVLTLPALGQDVQLGMLYDVRTAQFFGGVSLWNNEIVNATQTLDDHKIQNAEFTKSYSIEEARSHVALDVEGSLSLDLGLIRATGSAKYLSDKKSSSFEACAAVSCTVVRRTRRIPQEILSSMQHETKLEDPRFTHFVAEVVEGGSATLSFVQSCSSSEDSKTVLGELKAMIAKLPIDGTAKVDSSQQSDSLSESLKISYSGAIAENVSSLEDARRVAREMPTKLRRQLNTLHYKLLPLSILDSSVSREIRSLDANLVMKTAAALKAGTVARLQLKDVVEQDVFETFPAIKQQISNIQTAFTAVETEFTQAARRLLPELRDGHTIYSTKRSELEGTVAIFEQRTRIAEQFIAKKCSEAGVLQATVASLLADGFENDLAGLSTRSLADADMPRLLLSFGGASITGSRHPLQKDIESSKICVTASDGDSESNDDNDKDEWFENHQTVASVRNACATLRQLRAQASSSVHFGLAGLDKAHRPGREKRTKTAVGDIVLGYKGKFVIVTGMLPKPPTSPTIKINCQTITVEWSQERSKDEELTIPTTGFIVRFCRRPNPFKDGAFPRVTDNETFEEIHYEASETSAVIDKFARGALLSDDCDYEIGLSLETIVGRSEWSRPVVGRTAKLPSVASKILKFYQENDILLSKPQRDVFPWELYQSRGKKSLFLGLTVEAKRPCTDPRFQGQVAVRVVDVAAEFEPHIVAAPTDDSNNTIVAVFVGSSGHGKSTQINAFISYLLGGEADDVARIMVIDDRGAKQHDSVTQHITCYRIRPLSTHFKGKTLLIVDTPGYGDSRGLERDAFVTAAMSEFFNTIGHVNAIIFTCRANEARTTFLSPVSTYVFSLFAKDVQSCLRTIYTFSDAGNPLARGSLRALKWPVENGEVEANNAAFTIELDAQNAHKVRDWWLMSIKSQFQVMQMLIRMPPVPTDKSAFVTRDRLELERKCEMTEKKILRTANDAQNLIATMGALANAVGAAPGEKIWVEEDMAVSKPVQDGKATTLCIKCNWTCHEICMYGDDNDKIHCAAMDGGSCRVCKGRCNWSQHKNAKHIIVMEKHSEWVVPEDLISRWNANNNTLEGALLDVMDAYLSLQEELRNDILYLAKLSERLMDSALLHDPSALINYVETLIQVSRARGAPPEQLVQLTTAKNTLILVREVKQRGKEAAAESRILLQIIRTVRSEMYRRMSLKPRQRAKEEEKSCSLYNDLHAKLPHEIQKKAPSPLKKSGYIYSGALYPENLQAIVKLVQVVLRDGGVVAALAASH